MHDDWARPWVGVIKQQAILRRICQSVAEIILGVASTNEKQRYSIARTIFNWMGRYDTHNDLWISQHVLCILLAYNFQAWSNCCFGLFFRVGEVRAAGLDRFIYDPDKSTTLRLLQEYLKRLPTVPEPDISKWTDNLDGLPMKYGYGAIVEYLVKRQAAVLANTDSLPAMVPLPTADKPLLKGFNFFASGHVGEIVINCDSVTHIRTTVLASMREIRYDVKCALDNITGLVIFAACQCPAGAAGKCNHVAALLFALLDFVSTMRNPDSCTNKPQTWHRPKRKRKSATRPSVVGARKVAKHVYGKESKRRGPLDDYASFQPLTAIVQPDRNILKTDLRDLQLNHHSIGLFQVLDSSTDTASSDEDEMTENSTPEEIVVSKLQVSIIHFAGLPGIILCMGPANDRWHYSVMPSLIGWPMHRMIPGLQFSSIFLNERLEMLMLWFKYILWPWNSTNSLKMQK